MNLETAVIITKGFCLTYIPLGSALAEGMDPAPIPGLLGLSAKTITTATVVGSGGLLAFLSSSFGKYMNSRNGSSNDSTVDKTTGTVPP